MTAPNASMAQMITTPVNMSCEALFDTSGNSTAPLKGIPDIAGIGVISSFMVSAYLSWVVAAVCYLRLLPPNLLNDYDKLFVRARQAGDDEKWFKALRSGVMAFSDTQILQGVGILVAGFVNVKSLTVYHWQLVCYMAWLSSNVHLTTLTFLREYLVQHPMLLKFRLTGMIILLIMLIVAFVPTSSMDWVYAVIQDFDREHYPVDDGGTGDWFSLNYAMPVRCFWKPSSGLISTGVNPDAPFTYVILVASYGWKISSLLRRDNIKAGHTNQEKETGKSTEEDTMAKTSWFKRKVLGRILARAKTIAQQIPPQSNHGNTGVGHQLSHWILWLWTCFDFRVTLSIYAGMLALYDFLGSFLASIWALLLLLLWGTLEIATVRQKSSNLPKVHDEENEWGFGQVLPIMLLAAPLVATCNHFYRDKKTLYEIIHEDKANAIVHRDHHKNVAYESKMARASHNPAYALADFGRRRPSASISPSRRSLVSGPSNEANIAAHEDQRQASSASLASPASSLAGLRYHQLDNDSRGTLRHPKTTLARYLVSIEDSEPDLDKVSRDFFYRSWIFRSLLLLPNLILMAGGAWFFYIEGQAATENARKHRQGGFSLLDPKGNVWKLGLEVAMGSLAVWVAWATVLMFCSRLFRSR